MAHDIAEAVTRQLGARRWARRAKNITAEQIMDGIHELAVDRFVVLDEDTEEVLVRSLIRNDGVWKQPKILACAINEASVIASERLRTAVVEELGKIDPSELSDKVKPEVIALLETLPAELPQAHADAPPEGPEHLPRAFPPNGRMHGPTEGDRGRGGNGEYVGDIPATSTRPLPRARGAQRVRRCSGTRSSMST